jgi:hypothetical protein
VSGARELIEERRLELVRRADGVAVLILSGEAPFEAERELAAIADEQAFLERLLEALIGESLERSTFRAIERACARLTRGRPSGA